MSADSQSMGPAWAAEMLACPRCRGALSADLVCKSCSNAGKWVEGIACFNIPDEDPAIAWFKAKGGSNFRERIHIPYTMSSLDTNVYHSYVGELKPSDLNAVVVDVGVSDGRNSEPWLRWGYRRVIGLDVNFASLARFRDYAAKESPQWLERLLLVQCDARHLPVRNAVAEVALAIEVLYYLNEEYETGLAECARLLTPKGRLMLSEPSHEGAYLTSLLYSGIGEMLKMREDVACFEKSSDNKVLRSRNFTQEELRTVVEKTGLAVLEEKSISFISLVIGYLRGEGKLSAEDQKLFPDVCKFLAEMGKMHTMRRTHVVVAKPVSSPSVTEAV